uniref:Dimer_Tnp_hAT domain-containing protein n=1 Tax=Meloidogyne hapla TaxID=6305 RepID=A0A1I8B9B8_MELHA
MAKRYLSAPSTSVASEQLFSVARDVFDYRRSRLSPENAEMLIFLHNSIPDLMVRSRASNLPAKGGDVTDSTTNSLNDLKYKCS